MKRIRLAFETQAHKEVFWVCGDWRFPQRQKGKFYKTKIRLKSLDGSELRATKKILVCKMSMAHMRMIRLMSGSTRKDRVRNWYIGALIEDIEMHLLKARIGVCTY